MAYNPFTVDQSLQPTAQPKQASWTDNVDWQMLSAMLAGFADVASEGRTKPVTDITRQAIGAKSQNDLLRRLLAGEIPGAKLSADEQGMKINLPRSAATEALGGGETLKSTAGTSQPTTIQPPSYGASANPFGQGQVGSGNVSLAGLSPSDVTNAFGMMLKGRELDMQTYNAVVDAMYKSSLMKKYGAETRDLSTPFPVEVPGIGQVTRSQWNALTNEDKEYALFVQVAKNIGDTDILSKREWQLLEPTERERFLRAAMDDPKLMEAARNLAEAQSTKINIGEKVETALALSGISGQKYFNDPKWTSELDKYLESDSVRQEWMFKDNPDKSKAAMIEKFIEQKITGGGGKITDVRLEGRTGIWSVTWANGKKQEIKYEF